MKLIQLMKAMIEISNSGTANSLKQMVKIIADFYQMPVLVCTTDYTPLAQYPQTKQNDLGWNLLLENQGVSSEYLNEVNEADLMRRSFEAIKPFYLEDPFYNQEPRVIAPIRLNHTVAGFFVIYWSSQREYLPKDQEIIEMLLGALVVEFRKRDFGQATYPSPISLFLKNLLEGRLTTTQEITQWSNLARKTITGNYCLIAASVKTTDKDSFKYLLPQLNLELNEKYSEFMSIVLENCIYVFLTQVKEKKDVLVVNRILQKYALHTGISEIFSDLLDINMFKKQAEDALAFSNTSKKPVSHFYEDVMLRIILNQTEQQFSANFYHPALKLLTEFDETHDTVYSSTLRCYVRSYYNTNEAAKELNIHRNTLAYRLTKIKELTALDLNDKEVKLLLLMNYYQLS